MSKDLHKPVTLKQIAALINKTSVTVSKALRNHPDISPETKAEIVEIAQKMGYTPNLIARKLSSREKNTIGLVVPKVAHPFFSQVIEAIYDEAHNQGYDIFMMVSGEDPEMEIHHIKTLLSLQVDGFLISVSEKTCDAKMLDAVLPKGKKVVFFDRILDIPGCSSVVCDNYQGSYNLVSFALKNGYSRIGYLAGYSNISIGKERRRGFEQALKDSNIPSNTSWIVEGGFDQRDGYEGFKKINATGDLPEIVYTVSFAAAMGAMMACKELGLSIPEDIEIISFGDSEFNAYTKPSLTAAHLDAPEIGRRAVNLLIKQLLNAEAECEHIVVPTKLVVHETGLGRRQVMK